MGVNKICRLFLGRRQSNQVKVQASYQSSRIGRFRGADSSVIQSPLDKQVDRAFGPAVVGRTCWRGDILQSLKRPVRFCSIHFGIDDVGVVGPNCALIDPSTKQADLFFGQRLGSFRRHQRVVFSAGHQVDEQAVFAVAREDDFVAVSIFECLGFDSKVQASFFRCPSVALVTVVAKDRLDIADKVDLAGALLLIRVR